MLRKAERLFSARWVHHHNRSQDRKRLLQRDPIALYRQKLVLELTLTVQWILVQLHKDSALMVLNGGLVE